ncbi:ferredoxin/adrenodoxin [Anaeramoeba flamelloides]|uniref:Ferredoxin/adrenodoxin n=1 Tax=Anaeramoeba flamelloides TaxID=1746091 RepID=A0ABQ8YTV1_9EUKA|nr:ferredoxin/adrenodoxin [Anaeramoeba flamelloides]
MLSLVSSNLKKSPFSGINIPKRFLEVFVLDTTGKKHTIEFEEGDTLFEAVENAGHSFIPGSCNGGIACGECVVFVPEGQMENVSELEEDEKDCMEATGTTHPSARLACGLILDEDSEVINKPPHKQKEKQQQPENSEIDYSGDEIENDLFPKIDIDKTIEDFKEEEIEKEEEEETEIENKEIDDGDEEDIQNVMETNQNFHKLSTETKFFEKKN